MAAWSLSASGVGAGPNAASVTGLSCTGADLIVGWVAKYDSTALTGSDFTDTSLNSWTHVATEYASAEDANIRSAWFYKISPATSGSQDFTITKIGNFLALIVMVFSQGSAPTFVTQVGVSEGSAQSSQPGSIGNANDLVVSGLNYDSAISGLSIDSSFANLTHQAYAAANNEGAAVAWLQVSGAVNPTFSWTTSRRHAASSISFTGTGGSGGPTIRGAGLYLPQAVKRAANW